MSSARRSKKPLRKFITDASNLRRSFSGGDYFYIGLINADLFLEISPEYAFICATIEIVFANCLRG